MTEREVQLNAELENEIQQKASIEKSIKNKQIKLKNSIQKISDLELAVKEEQLNSIRMSMDKNGIDFDAFREALEKGLLSNMNLFDKKENHEISEKIKSEDVENEND